MASEWTDWHERHADKIELVAGVDCWIWTAALSQGYGSVYYNGERVRAHRIAYMEACGPIPDGSFVRHICGNPLCVRPTHLKLGSAADNARDMAEMFTTSGKLRPWQVSAIRDEYRRGDSLSEIAERHGIAYGTVYPIVTGKSYRHHDAPTVKAMRSPRKLSDDDVWEIRRLCEEGAVSQRQIAQMFGVRQPMVSRIKAGIRHAGRRTARRQEGMVCEVWA